jgi:ABC-type multidrug transport system permease subunit
MFNQPHYLGHTWSAASLWIGAAVYLVAGVVFGVLGWRVASQRHHM